MQIGQVVVDIGKGNHGKVAPTTSIDHVFADNIPGTWAFKAAVPSLLVEQLNAQLVGKILAWLDSWANDSFGISSTIPKYLKIRIDLGIDPVGCCQIPSTIHGTTCDVRGMLMVPGLVRGMSLDHGGEE